MTQASQYTQIELCTLNGPEYRRVSTAPPRTPTDDEIPVIDLTAIDGTLEERRELAGRIRAAAQNTGFFYISNHGIPEEVIQNALAQAKAFFGQPEEEKQKVSDGYFGVGTTQINKSETKGTVTLLFVSYGWDDMLTKVCIQTAKKPSRYAITPKTTPPYPTPKT